MPHVSHVVTCHKKPHIDARYKLDDKVDREKRAEEREGASEGDTQGAPRRKNAQI